METKTCMMTQFGSISIGSKKGISPVIGIALLIVVAVVGVVGFQGWFNQYSSSLQIQAESESSNSLNTRIDRVIDDTLYFRNGGSQNLTIDRVEVGGQDCSISENISSGMNPLNLGNCTSNVSESVTDVVVYTQDGVYSQEVFLDTTTSSSTEDSQAFCEGNNVTEYDGLCWYNDIGGLGTLAWAVTANSTYSEPNYNGDEYVYPTGTTESDYPAFEACNTLDIDGYDNWRLPTLEEFVSKTCDDDFTSANGFSDCVSFNYWTQNESSASSAFGVYLSYGGFSSFVKGNTYYVACVRRN